MHTNKLRTVLAVLLAFALNGVAQDKGKGKGKGGGGIPAPITITTSAYPDGGKIPAKYGCPSQGQSSGVSPALSWSGAPANTAAFAIIMHDPDVMFNGADVLHWAIFDIPGGVVSLPENLDKKPELPDGSKQINNIAGMPGYFNPCPPPPTTHHYIIEIYALNEKLGLPASTSRADLEKALGMHVMAKGVYVGTYKIP